MSLGIGVTPPTLDVGGGGGGGLLGLGSAF
jgi:hypothetical protein